MMRRTAALITLIAILVSGCRQSEADPVPSAPEPAFAPLVLCLANTSAGAEAHCLHTLVERPGEP